MTKKFRDTPPAAVRHHNDKRQQMEDARRRKPPPLPPEKLFTKETRKAKSFRRWKDNRLGKFGPASPVRRICPVTGKVIEEP